MKTYFKPILVAASLALMAVTNASAQDPKYGSNPDECKKYYSFIRTAYSSGELNECMTYWRELVKICPALSYNLYVYGSEAIINQINIAKTPEAKAKYVDTLMMCYDLWGENFSTGKNVMSSDQVAYRKALKLIEFTPERNEQILKEIDNYINLKKDDADFDASMTVQAFQQVKLMYEKKVKSADDVMAAYEKYFGLVEGLIKKTPGNKELEDARANIEGMFITIEELASCDNLVAFFTPKFQANPKDIDLLGKIVHTLQARKCVDTPLFSDAAEALYAAQPTAETAMALASLFILKEEYAKAAEYMKHAIGFATDPIEKSTLETQLATLYLNQLNNSTQALSYAKQAASHNPNNGSATVIIGTVYAKYAVTGAKNCGEIDSKAVFWVVVDVLSRAKQQDPSLTDEVNKSINQYSAYFPTKEDIFMNGLKEGDGYTVNCGIINERTTIRGRR